MLNNAPLRIAAIGMRGMPSAYSGIERANESLYSRLAARGHQITVYCRSTTLKPRVEQYKGIRLLHVPTVKHKALDTTFHNFMSALHATTIERYDVIHLHALAAGLVVRIPQLRGVPTVVTVHGLDWRRAKWVGLGSRMLRLGERYAARYADEVIAISQDVQEHFLTCYGREVAYIPNGAERSPQDTPSRDDLSSFGLAPDRYIAYVGRLVPEKRVHDLINAFHRVPTGHRLAIVGEGGYSHDYVDQLKKIASRDPRVVFTGHLQGNRLESVYRGAASLVLPSELEGLPLSLLEAMERSVPAIVTDIAPHRELLGSVPGYDLFFPCGDIDSLAERISSVLQFPDRAAEVSARAKIFVRAQYSWDVSTELTEQLLYRVAAKATLERSYRLVRKAIRTPQCDPEDVIATEGK